MTEKEILEIEKLKLEKERHVFEERMATKTHELEKLRIIVAIVAIAAPVLAAVVSASIGFYAKNKDNDIKRIDLNNKFEISLVSALAKGNHQEILKIGDALYVEQGDGSSAAWWCDVGKSYPDYKSMSCNNAVISEKINKINKAKWYLKNEK